MKRIAIVYYSGTGNTEEMANVLKDSLENLAEVTLITSDSFKVEDIASYDAFAFGCPAMGNEVLEEDSFEPMFTSVESALAGKDTVLFGSYGWGDGEWMRNWKERCESDKINLKAEPVIAQDAPDDTAKAELAALAKALIE